MVLIALARRAIEALLESPPEVAVVVVAATGALVYTLRANYVSVILYDRWVFLNVTATKVGQNICSNNIRVMTTCQLT